MFHVEVKSDFQLGNTKKEKRISTNGRVLNSVMLWVYPKLNCPTDRLMYEQVLFIRLPISPLPKVNEKIHDCRFELNRREDVSLPRDF